MNDINVGGRRDEIYQLIAEGKTTSEINALGKYDLSEIKSAKAQWFIDESARRTKTENDLQQARMARKNMNRPRRWNFGQPEIVTSSTNPEGT